MSAAKQTPTIRKLSEGGAEFVQTTVRFPPRLHARLNEMANGSGRSMHAEILFHIAAAAGEALPEQTGESTLDRMAADIRALRELAERFVDKVEGGAV